MSDFQRRHYIAIAKIIRKYNEPYSEMPSFMVDNLVKDFCILFREDNYDFSERKFKDAIGVL